MVLPTTFPTPAMLLKRSPALSEALQPDRIIPSLAAGSVTGMIGIIRAISYAALIFSGSLAPFLNVGVGMAICSSALISIVVALTSSLPGMIATPLAAPTAVLAILAAGITQTIGDSASPPERLLTVMAAIAIGSLATGLGLWLLGTLKLGKALQFIPYPVVGGFMAGTGWILIRGALKVMTGTELTFHNLTSFGQPEQLWHWLAGLAIALTLFLVTKAIQHYLALPATLLGATLVIYLVLWQTGLSFEAAHTQGWLLGPFPHGQLWQPLNWMALQQVHWPVIAQQSGTFALLAFVSLLSLVLTNGGIELALDRDLDLNCELRAIGLANFAAGLGSSMAGNQALPSTLLVHKMGAASRLTGLIKAIPCILVLILGPTFLEFFPKPLLGGLLLFLGLDLLWQWLYKAWFKFPLLDFCVIVMTLITISLGGFVAGILVGMGLTTVQFLYHCSQVETATLTQPDAVPAETPAMAQAEAAIQPLSHSPIQHIALQGFLFFGTMANLYQSLRQQVFSEPATAPIRYLILDFSAVVGLDSSGVLAFSKLLNLAKCHGTCLVYVGLSELFEAQLIKGQGLEIMSPYCKVLANRDRALLWCREQLKVETTQKAA